MSERQDSFRPRPRIAVGVSAVIVGLAVEDQIASGSVDAPLVSALVFLIAFWAGRTIDWARR